MKKSRKPSKAASAKRCAKPIRGCAGGRLSIRRRGELVTAHCRSTRHDVDEPVRGSGSDVVLALEALGCPNSLALKCLIEEYAQSRLMAAIAEEMEGASASSDAFRLALRHLGAWHVQKDRQESAALSERADALGKVVHHFTDEELEILGTSPDVAPENRRALLDHLAICTGNCESRLKRFGKRTPPTRDP